MVRGKQNPITCSSSLGEKARTPRMDSLAMDAMMIIILVERKGRMCVLWIYIRSDIRNHNMVYELVSEDKSNQTKSYFYKR